jgi:hypothetical protein
MLFLSIQQTENIEITDPMKSNVDNPKILIKTSFHLLAIACFPAGLE